MTTTMTSPPPDPPFRACAPAPFQLTERVRLLLEESLHPQALELYDRLLFCGISSPPSRAKPALLPPHTFLRYLTTLLVHPYWTSQTRGEREGPKATYTTLRRAITVVGPANLRVEEAWRFDKHQRSGKRSGRKAAAVDREKSPAASDDFISGCLAHEESLFSVAEDMWGVVGWAFNCSIAHRHRWEWWRPLLDVLLTALEQDWELRSSRFELANDESYLKHALIVKMLPDTKGSGGYRRVIRAIFADAEGKAKNEFKELWVDELSTRRPKGNARRKFDASMSGNNIGTDTEDEDPEEEGDTEMSDDADEGAPDAVEAWGGLDSVRYRQRFLSLLSAVSASGQFIPVDELYHEFKDTILQCPFPSFILWTSTFLPADRAYRASLSQIIITTIISSASPAYSAADDNLSQATLVERFLSWPAKNTSITDNAKVSVLVEGLMRLLFAGGFLKWTQELDKAVEDGIKERRKKGTQKGRVKAEDVELVERYWESSERQLRIMVQVLKMRNK